MFVGFGPSHFQRKIHHSGNGSSKPGADNTSPRGYVHGWPVVIVFTVSVGPQIGFLVVKNGPLPFMAGLHGLLINGGDPNYLRPSWDDPPSRSPQTIRRDFVVMNPMW